MTARSKVIVARSHFSLRALRALRETDRVSVLFRSGLLSLLAPCGVASLRADTVFSVPTEPTSGVSVRLSTPLVATPRFGFMPILVRVTNSSGSNGSWSFDFRSGGPEGVATEIRRTVTVQVAAGQNREQWIYLPVPDPGVGALAAAPVAIRNPATAAAPAPAAPVPPPAAAAAGNPGAIRIPLPPIGGSVAGSTLSAAQAELATATRLSEQLRMDPASTMQQRAAASTRVAQAEAALRMAGNAQAGPNSLAQLQALRAELTARYRLLVDTGALPATATALVQQINTVNGQIAVIERAQLPAALQPTGLGTSVEMLSVNVAIAQRAVDGLRTQIGLLEARPTANAATGDPVQALATARAALTRAEATLRQAQTDLTNATVTSFRLSTSGPAPGAIATFSGGLVGGSSISPAIALRDELTRLGFLGVAGVSTSSGGLSNATHYTAFYAQTGPVASLPEPAPGSLPPHLSVTMDTSGPAGTVTRTFFLVQPISSLGRMPGATAVAGDLRTTTWTIAPAQGLIQVAVSGLGVPARTEMVLSAALEGGTLTMPPLAATMGLETALRGKLAGLVRGGTPSIATVEYAALPADWRVWSSFHGVILRAGTLDSLDPARKAALRQWVALGGKLFVFPGGFGGRGGRGGGGGGRGAGERIEYLGAGAIYHVVVSPQDSEPLDIAQALRLTSVAPSLPTRGSLEISPNYKLPGAMTRSGRIPNGWLVAGLVAIAVIAAPVNLFVFAPRGRRHRLFLTTPIVALAGAAAFGTVVVINDGLGGHGQRSAVVAILPGENSAAVFQDQIARTGVIASRRFPLEDGVLMTSLPVDPSFVPVMHRDADRASGDWFRPRSFQAQHIRAIVPTRARVEVVATGPDGAPVVQSSLPSALLEFSYLDPAGRNWFAGELPPGRRVTLSAAAGDVPAPQVEQLTANLAALFAEMAVAGPGRWKARTAPAEFIPLDTHGAIQWIDSDVLITGVMVVPGSTLAGAPAANPDPGDADVDPDADPDADPDSDPDTETTPPETP